ncbi:4-hydroxythreonine-4-phosphate dehydrogenase PdxA [Fodinicurvata sp. EGI_FJ10296]|uniref:4-hydroxythreonine-4-phosphate dehydrogenase PdxA n=1 Tax=Fodinicurvata sp. EGI_FJ10296 TaxID=3231908 RepID=UPI00345343FC
MTGRKPTAVTMGEPAGIGGELTLAAWRRADSSGLAPFFAIDDPRRLSAIADGLGLDVPIREIAAPADAERHFPDALPVLPVGTSITADPGHPSPASAAAVIASIDRAVSFCLDGSAGAVVTQPIQKETLYRAGFSHPGHTEYLAALCGGTAKPVMMLACADLRVVPVTIHQSLATVAETLNADLIGETLATTAIALIQDFGIAAPRIAVAGLNPHAGEGGRFGDEETTVIAPGIAAASERLIGILGAEMARRVVFRGPLSADTMFHPAARARYDAAVCMYHDQALIPIKTIDFDRGVNVTLGLPIVRTSPDHGTALDIAGKGSASAESFIEALKLAADMAGRRADLPR